MRPPGGILAPGETIIATVFRFVEHPENNEKPLDQKCKVKFKIVSLKVKGPVEYVPELVKSFYPFRPSCHLKYNPCDFIALSVARMSQFDEQKDQVAVEQILRVVFLDAERPSAVSDGRYFLFIFFRPVLLSGSKFTVHILQYVFFEATGQTQASTR
jgi:hypothetical protein